MDHLRVRVRSPCGDAGGPCGRALLLPRAAPRRQPVLTTSPHISPYLPISPRSPSHSPSPNPNGSRCSLHLASPAASLWRAALLPASSAGYLPASSSPHRPRAPTATTPSGDLPLVPRTSGGVQATQQARTLPLSLPLPVPVPVPVPLPLPVPVPLPRQPCSPSWATPSTYPCVCFVTRRQGRGACLTTWAVVRRA